MKVEIDLPMYSPEVGELESKRFLMTNGCKAPKNPPKVRLYLQKQPKTAKLLCLGVFFSKFYLANHPLTIAQKFNFELNNKGM